MTSSQEAVAQAMAALATGKVAYYQDKIDRQAANLAPYTTYTITAPKSTQTYGYDPIISAGDAFLKGLDDIGKSAGNAAGSAAGAAAGSFVSTTIAPFLMLGLLFMVADKQEWL